MKPTEEIALLNQEKFFKRLKKNHSSGCWFFMKENGKNVSSWFPFSHQNTKYDLSSVRASLFFTLQISLESDVAIYRSCEHTLCVNPDHLIVSYKYLDGSKDCIVCQEQKESDQFSKGGKSNICKLCINEYGKKYYSGNKELRKKLMINKQKRIKRNEQYIIEILKRSSCKDCSESNIVVLEFDHLPEFKKRADIAILVHGGYSTNAIQEELDKCDIVCRNCHRIRTSTRQENRRYQIFRQGLAPYITETQKLVLEEIRLSSCKECKKDDPMILEFHHIDPAQKILKLNTSSVASRSFSLVQKEIKKCEILCANCHMIHTAHDQNHYKINQAIC